MFSQTPKIQRSSRKKHISTPASQSHTASIQALPANVDKPPYLLSTNTVSIQQLSVYPLQFQAKRSIIDPSMGYCAILQADQLIVWNYKNNSVPMLRHTYLSMPLDLATIPEGTPSSKRIHSQSNTPIGTPSINRSRIVNIGTPADSQNQDQSSLCLASFFTSNQTVGVVAINSAGLIRLWDNCMLYDSYKEMTINLDGTPTLMINCEQVGFLVALDSGSLIRISLSSKTKMLTANYLTRQVSLATSVFSLFGTKSRGNSITPADEQITALVAGNFEQNRFSRSVFVLTNEHLMKWEIGFGNTETFLWETNLLKAVAARVSAKDIEIVDMDYAKGDRLCFLICADDVYYLATCEDDQSQNHLSIVGMVALECQSKDPNDSPSLSLSNGGPIALICFKDQIVITYLFDDVNYEEIIPLKRKDLIGCGVDKSKLFFDSVESKSVAAICCSTVGVLELEVYVSSLIQSTKRKDTKEVVQIKADFSQKLEQAVFFASSNEDDNPIEFDLKKFTQGLDEPVLALSGNILNASNPHLPNILDETAYLAESMYRMNEIAAILSKNDLIDHLSLESRFALMYNAEKLNAMKSLWVYQDEIYQKNASNAYLERAVARFCQSNQIQTGIRGFFKAMAVELDSFMCSLDNNFNINSTNRTLIENDFDDILERGKIFTIVYSSILEYRKKFGSLYQSDFSRLFVLPWTATLEMISAMQVQFELVVAALDRISAIKANEEDIDASFFGYFLEQMVELSHFLLSTVNDLKQYSVNAGATDRNLHEINERYTLLQKNALGSMLKYNLEKEAFTLAETFEDLDALVELTLTHSGKTARIKQYMKKFGERFANILFHSYVTSGNLHTLMQSHDDHPEFVDRFLEREALDHLSWMAAIKNGNFLGASETLWKLSELEPCLKEQELALSIAKLAYLEALGQEEIGEYSEERKTMLTKVHKFDSAIDSAVMQNSLIEQFQTILDENMIDKDIDQKVKSILDNAFVKLRPNSVRGFHLHNSLFELLNGKRISLEHIIDLLSFQTNENALVDCMQFQLDHKADLKDSTDYYLNQLWRQCWLNEDWGSILQQISSNSSDNQLVNILKETSPYAIIRWLFDQYPPEETLELALSPSKINLIFPPNFDQIYMKLGNEKIHHFKREYENDQKSLKKQLEEYELEKVYTQLLAIIQRERQNVEMEVD